MEEQQSTILPDISRKSRASRPESKIAKPPPVFKSKSPMGRSLKNSKLNPPLPVLYEVPSKLEATSVHQLLAKTTESKYKQEVAPSSVHQLPAIETERKYNESPSEIESKSPTVKKTRITARRRSRIPVRNKQKFRSKSPTDKTWPNSKLKIPFSEQHDAGMDSQGAVPVPGDQLPTIQRENTFNESPQEIKSSAPTVKTGTTRKPERKPLLPVHNSQNSEALDKLEAVPDPGHQELPANQLELKSIELPSEIEFKPPTVKNRAIAKGKPLLPMRNKQNVELGGKGAVPVPMDRIPAIQSGGKLRELPPEIEPKSPTMNAWTVAKCRPPLPVYNYEKLRRQGVVPVPVHQLPPIPEIVRIRSTSDQLDFYFPGWDDPKQPEANTAYHVARSERTNIDIEEIPQLIFKYDRNKDIIFVEFEFQNLTNRPLMFRITGDDRLIVLPSIGTLHPYETLMVQVNADYRNYDSSMRTFFKQKLFVETLIAEVYFRKRSVMVEYIKNNYTRVRMMFLDRFMIYRKPKDAVGVCDEREAFRMIEHFDDFDSEVEMLREELEKEAAERRNNGDARRLILEATESMILESPEPILSIRTLRALVIGAAVTAVVLGIWIFFCVVGATKSKGKWSSL